MAITIVGKLVNRDFYHSIVSLGVAVDLIIIYLPVISSFSSRMVRYANG